MSLCEVFLRHFMNCENVYDNNFFFIQETLRILFFL